LAKQTTTAHAQKLRDYGREVVEERDALMGAAQGAITELSEIVKEQVDERPYTVLGAAFGLGLVLGGGLPLGVLGFTARAAAGIAARQMVESMMPLAAGTAPRSRGRANGEGAAAREE
jgi:hypothetical protein